MNIKLVNNLIELNKYYQFFQLPLLAEDDLDVIETDCDLFERKRRDAESLCTVVANNLGNCLDIGTSHGRSAFKMATNLGEGTVYTVNVLPEQILIEEEFVTHLLTREEIGSFYQKYNLKNIRQLYANTLNWDIPSFISNLSVVFVDGNHDTYAVYSDSKLAYDRLKEGGFILWHDFNPLLRSTYSWIEAAMKGVEKFLIEYEIETEIVSIRNSWVGIMQKKPRHTVNSFLACNSKQQTTTEIFQPINFAEMKTLRYLLVYPAYSIERKETDEELANNIRELGYSIDTFPIPCPNGWWQFPKLDYAWKNRSPELMTIYDDLEKTAQTFDVLIAAGGSMLHPEFVATLPTYNIFICGDDPESSEILSKPVAPYFDYSFPLNASCNELYRSWGCHNVDWLFIPVYPRDFDPSITEESILNGKRDVDIALFCDRATGLSNRSKRIEKLIEEFPQSYIRGNGWPGGFASSEERKRVYRNTKLGWNLHHSTGPINSRLMILPAYGILQLCDNKKYLGRVFELDKEVVGFDSLDECIDKTRYFLSHNKERREIAAQGWKRVKQDYTVQRWWERLLSCIASDYKSKKGAIDINVQPLNAVNASDFSNIDTLYIKQKIDLNGHFTKPNADTFEPLDNRREAPLNILPVLRPRIILLVDRPGWAYDTVAQALIKFLGNEFDFLIHYVIDQPDLGSIDFDLIYVFFWGETYHQKYAFKPNIIIKEVSSHRWANEANYGYLTPLEMINRFLFDAETITCTSQRIEKLIAPYRNIKITPNGVDTSDFYDLKNRKGPLCIGWAGNATDPCKGVHDILMPAAGNDFILKIAPGNITRHEMLSFYNSIDVLCVASTTEGQPLPLLEAMSCGCFPVCVDVGIVPEVVTHGKSGLVVDRSISAFREAFKWCASNIEFIRKAGSHNSEFIRQHRTWDTCISYFRNAFHYAISLKLNNSQNSKHTSNYIDDFKLNYSTHLKAMNPGNLEDVYNACLFYYEAEILPLLPEEKQIRTLDIGSGFGHLMRFLSENGYQSVTGVELDSVLHQISLEYTGKLPEEVINGDANIFLQSQNESFDFISILDVIEHFKLDEAIKLARLTYNALRSGGLAVFRTPNMANIFGIYSRYMDITHQNGFTEFSLSQLLREAGFNQIGLHMPKWNSSNPLAQKFKESADFQRSLFGLQDRKPPQCFDKNIVVWARK
jgi:glycosyltransferase involved in cell wall biosynthesis/predicted O-methyltransferase YrrM